MDDDPNKWGLWRTWACVSVTRVIIRQGCTKMCAGLWVRSLSVTDSPLHSSLYAWHSHMWFSKMTNYILLWTFIYVECSEFHPWGTLLWRTEDLYSFLSSVAHWCLTIWDLMDLQHARPPCPSPTPEFTQTHVLWVSDAIQPSHPLSSPSSPTFSLSSISLFKWVSSSHQVAKVLEFQLQHQSFQWTPRTDLL